MRKIFIVLIIVLLLWRCLSYTAYPNVKTQNKKDYINIFFPYYNSNNVFLVYNDLPDETEINPIQIKSVNTQIQRQITQDDIELIAAIVYAESKGEPYEGKGAVASVILNRALNNGFPNTIQDVIFQPKAFSCIVDGSIDVQPTQECFDAVYDALSGNDPTGDAVFFYNPDIATCTWMQGVEKHNIVSIGQHLFFTL